MVGVPDDTVGVGADVPLWGPWWGPLWGCGGAAEGSLRLADRSLRIVWGSPSAGPWRSTANCCLIKLGRRPHEEVLL